MNAIINMTGLALDTELTPKQQQYLSVSHSSAKNLLGIINDILDFSKIEAEKLELEQAPFSLRGVLEEVTETFRARVVEKHVELITHVVHDVPNELIGDALRFRQVITNLVGNAFKFTSEGEVVVKVVNAVTELEEERRSSGWSGRVDDIGARHRDRDSEGPAGRIVPGLLAGGHFDVAQVWRYGSGPGDQPPTGAHDGW